jgi:hypothetical protein
MVWMLPSESIDLRFDAHPLGKRDGLGALHRIPNACLSKSLLKTHDGIVASEVSGTVGGR